MSKICTSLEQSQKLIELGIDVKTADMDYIQFANNPKEYDCVVNVWNNEHEKDWIPAWSLAALLNAVDFSTINLHYDNARIDWVASATIHDSTKHCTKYESTRALNPVDAFYKMIIKLYELNLL